MLNRTVAPQAYPIASTKLIRPQTINIGNSIIYHYPSDLPVVKIEFVLGLNSISEKQIGANFFTVKMLQEGSKKLTAEDISNLISQKGAFLEITPGIKRSSIVIYTLSKYVKELLPVLFELIIASCFPEEQLQKLKDQTLNTLRVNKAKNAYLATKSFNQHLFGANHFYGRKMSEEDIKNINSSLLTQHHKAFLNRPEIDSFVTGQINDEDIKTIERFITSLNTSTIGQQKLSVTEPSQFNVIEDISTSVQSTIKLGKLTITKDSIGYPALYLLNEILGGYFGSRLMTNLREERGLTYGIYSRLKSHLECSIFEISADVIKKDRTLALEEIKKELSLLSTDVISEEEIKKVKHYIAGSLLNSFSSIFDHSEKFKTLLYQNLPLDFYDTLTEKIDAVSSDQLQSTAQEYLPLASMNSVTVG